MRFDFVIEYKKGGENIAAYALSWRDGLVMDKEIIHLTTIT